MNKSDFAVSLTSGASIVIKLSEFYIVFLMALSL